MGAKPCMFFATFLSVPEAVAWSGGKLADSDIPGPASFSRLRGRGNLIVPSGCNESSILGGQGTPHPLLAQSVSEQTCTGMKSPYR